MSKATQIAAPPSHVQTTAAELRLPQALREAQTLLFTGCGNLAFWCSKAG